MCFYSVRSACSAITPKQSVPVCPTPASKTTVRTVLYLPSPGCAFYFCTSEQKSLCRPPISPSPSQSVLVHSSLRVPPTGNQHRCNQCMCVQHPRKQPQSNVCSTCRPSPLQSLLARSFSTPVNQNHCAFHPPAITIAISACAFQSLHSTHRQSTRCNQHMCVQHPCQQPQFTVCSTWRNQNLRFLFLHQ